MSASSDAFQNVLYRDLEPISLESYLKSRRQSLWAHHQKTNYLENEVIQVQFIIADDCKVGGVTINVKGKVGLTIVIAQCSHQRLRVRENFAQRADVDLVRIAISSKIKDRDRALSRLNGKDIIT